MRTTIVLLILAVKFAGAQQGIVFQHGKSWSDIKKIAKEQNKYIFVDAFTTWCGPCKMMSTEIFPMPEVGTFYNDHFINVKAQMDSTASDSDYVKQFYADAHSLMVDYDIQGFPTFLYFNPDGQPVHRALGSTDEERFIERGKNAMDPAKQYYTLKAEYVPGRTDTATLRTLVDEAADAFDKKFFDSIAQVYLNTQKDLFTPHNLGLLQQITHKAEGSGFDVFYRQGKKVDLVLGAGRSHQIVTDIVLEDRIFPRMYPSGQPVKNVDWIKIEAQVKKEFPDLAKEVVLEAKATHSLRFGGWKEFSTAYDNYVKLFSANIPSDKLNMFAWAVFEQCDDPKCLQSALYWSKSSLKGSSKDDAGYLDTYANLLYKLGRKDEAIAAEQRAIDVSGRGGADMLKTLDKMKKGDKTW